MRKAAHAVWKVLTGSSGLTAGDTIKVLSILIGTIARSQKNEDIIREASSIALATCRGELDADKKPE
jgi:hypothetical protein